LLSNGVYKFQYKRRKETPNLLGIYDSASLGERPPEFPVSDSTKSVISHILDSTKVN